MIVCCSFENVFVGDVRDCHGRLYFSARGKNDSKYLNTLFVVSLLDTPFLLEIIIKVKLICLSHHRTYLPSLSPSYLYFATTHQGIDLRNVNLTLAIFH